jgi:hypothetical protein
MRLPDCESLDDVYRWLLARLDEESAYRLQQLLRDRETEAAQLWIALGRREMLLQIQCTSMN